MSKPKQKSEWIKITKNGFCGPIVYIGRDLDAARAAMTEPYYVYNCYSGATENGPWYFMRLDLIRAYGLKAS